MGVFRWGIIGTGDVARKMAATLAHRPDAELVAVTSTTASRRESLAREHDALAVASPAQLEGIVDAVYVASTNVRHRGDTESCLDAGLAVLCEKPLAGNLDEVRAMVRKARASRTLLMEAMWSRFLPFQDRLGDLLASRELGEVRLVQSTLSYPVDLSPDRRWANADLAGGALLDLGVYGLDLVLRILGEPHDTHLASTRSPQGVDLQSAVTGAHEHGALSTTTVSFHAAAPRVARISGTKGHVELGPEFHRATVLNIQVGGRTSVVDVPYRGAGFDGEIDEMHRCIEAGLPESPAMSLGDSLRLHRWIDRVRRSHVRDRP